MEKLESLIHEWAWDTNVVNSSCCSSGVMFSDENSNVVITSSEKTVLKGDKPFEKGRHHFWSIYITGLRDYKIITFGIESSKGHFSGFYLVYFWDLSDETYCIEIVSTNHKYSNRLPFDTSLIGIHLGIHFDTWTGILRFLYNRRPLDIMFRNLNNDTFYPVIEHLNNIIRCYIRAPRETPTNIKLTYSVSMPVSLQSACLKVLTPSQKQILRKKFPGLRHLCQYATLLQKSHQ
ncbi:SPRY domain-containing SOCS box protein 3-like isoform X1 [Pseudomyrmex gracilis]|uniref:SPRY domain-containing SOCS box protein 3-like isoform X1 n=1 Tax=Pseudomyrmex gracilis TaxID=219809 RepID=UPI00099497D2|nr:SPRY domain-containing SOCS box protein 3-like isoform X1 [Pseudomyrmex gracilis]